MANNKGINPIAVVGAAVVGAAVGAAAVALSDEKTRNKIGKKFDELKKDGQKVYSDLKGKAENVVTSAGDKVNEVKKTVKSKL